MDIFLTPIFNTIESFVDNICRDTVKPKKGSILYCDLAFGYAEHSGIYVGGGEKCIVELHNTSGNCIIQRVTPKVFMEAGTAISIYVSCNGTDPVGKKKIANTALSMVGMNLGKYSLLHNNCHMFTNYCLIHGNKNYPKNYEWQDYVKHYIKQKMTLKSLKINTSKKLDADNWRVWNLHDLKKTNKLDCH